ncbi:LysM peptidoglycan-binding domain-containing protein [Mycobacterium sp.]|uniref:LysM peptidoglycan-binding domain-containing protein n=1 Tax=Mycobacterium sp. TaxID=1785 RepID=UPI0031DDF303
MTLMDTIPPGVPPRSRPVRGRPAGPRRLPGRRAARSSGPAVAPPRYRGTGVVMSTAPHRPRPVTPATTVVLALLAALITVWLGLIAHFGAAVGSGGQGDRVPGRLAVVRVEPGETLSQVAGRVAPDAPVGRVAQRIRQLNGLDSAAVTAGQTLIAPVD